MGKRLDKMSRIAYDSGREKKRLKITGYSAVG